MEQVFLLNAAEFYQKQSELVKSIIDESLQSVNTVNQEEILSISDVCTLLKKSRQTIITWSDKGILKRHYISDSLFYLRSEVMSALKDTKSQG